MAFMMSTREERIRDTITALSEGLRPEAHQFFDDFVRASLFDDNANRIIPAGRRILDRFETSMPVEIFLLSIQAQHNLYYEQVLDLVLGHEDPPTVAVEWLCVNYILHNRDTLAEVKKSRFG